MLFRSKEGEIDRSALGAIVFADEKARKDLEAIIHPLVRESSEKIASRAGDSQIVINQIPLLVETSGAKRFDFVITVEADLEIRRERLRARGMKDYEISRRISAQASDDEREAIANIVITNNGSLDELTREVERVWDSELKSRVEIGRAHV